MSADPVGPPRQESGQPQDHNSINPVVRAVERAVDELNTGRKFMERDLTEARADMKTALDRLTRIETKVEHLPSKTWIFTVAGGFVAAIGVLVAVIYKIATGH